jgi:ribosomal protein L19
MKELAETKIADLSEYQRILFDIVVNACVSMMLQIFKRELECVKLRERLQVRTEFDNVVIGSREYFKIIAQKAKKKKDNAYKTDDYYNNIKTGSKEYYDEFAGEVINIDGTPVQLLCTLFNVSKTEAEIYMLKELTESIKLGEELEEELRESRQSD